MIKGIYTSAAGMRANIARQDVTANNLANAQTSGFKRDRMFLEEMINAANPEKTLMESLKAGRFTEYTPGAFEPTEAPLDLAIQGQGFFTLDTEEGEQFTRDGHFIRNSEGILMDATGRKVLGEGGEISLPNGIVTVDSNGSISVNGSVVDKLRITHFDSLQDLTKEKGNAFSDKSGSAGAQPLERPTVLQGFLETSNVETMQEMVAMISASRNYEINAKLVAAQDETLRHVVNDVGRV